jgi:hypothetical protein
MNGQLDCTGMNDHQIDTLMQWQARADQFERKADGLALILLETQQKLTAAEDEVEKWKNAAAARDGTTHEETSADREQLHRCQKEKAHVVNALRCLVELLAPQPDASLTYFIGSGLKKAVREAAELLSIIEAVKHK